MADYNNVEREFFSKRMCVMFAAAFLGLVVMAVIDIAGLERTQPFATIVSVAGGLVGGALLTGLVYASRTITKLKASRTRLLKSLRSRTSIRYPRRLWLHLQLSYLPLKTLYRLLQKPA